jgi:hypothetical protein
MYEINDLKGGHELDMDEYKPIIEMKIPNWINN